MSKEKNKYSPKNKAIMNEVTILKCFLIFVQASQETQHLQEFLNFLKNADEVLARLYGENDANPFKHQLKIHRCTQNELVLVDRFGYTYHVLDGSCYVVKYPLPQDIKPCFLSQLIQDFCKAGCFSVVADIAKFANLKAEDKAKGFDYYGDLWELGAEIIDEHNKNLDFYARKISLDECITANDMLDKFRSELSKG